MIGVFGSAGFKLLISILLLIELRPAIHAQYHIDSWTTDDGLPQNTVQAITQTRDGYLWLATNDGLARFDGLKFKVFDSMSTPGFCCDRLTTLYEDRDGNLWIGSDDSIVLQYRSGTFNVFRTFDVPGINTFTLQGTKDGELLVSSPRGLLRGSPGSLKHVNTESDIYYLDASI